MRDKKPRLLTADNPNERMKIALRLKSHMDTCLPSFDWKHFLAKAMLCDSKKYEMYKNDHMDKFW